MGEFVHVYNDGGGIRNVPILQGAGVVLGGKDGNPVPNSGSSTILSVGIPFVILPGDGSANGMFFTGTAGAFTLSAAILTNAWNALKGCWCYLPANFGGKTYPAGWYWAVFSSDTAGILYNNTYSSGIPTRPSTLTPFADNLAGWLTQTTSEITGPTGFTLKGGSLGPNGTIKCNFRTLGTTAGNKTFRVFMDSTPILGAAPGGSPVADYLVSLCNQGSESLQLASASGGSGTGVGSASSAFSNTSYTAIDTTVNRTLSFSLQISTTAPSAVLLHADVTVTYGA